jgi:hypothetical protein
MAFEFLFLSIVDDGGLQETLDNMFYFWLRVIFFENNFKYHELNCQM